MKSERAFTLIELLVVIAIIALLVSILMPSLARAKELAKSAGCMTQERTVGWGLALYCEESNAITPPPYKLFSASPYLEMTPARYISLFDDKYIPYRGSTSYAPKEAWGCLSVDDKTNERGSYCMNKRVYDISAQTVVEPWGSGSVIYFKASLVKAPSSLYCMGEVVPGWYDGFSGTFTETGVSAAPLTFRHAGRNNVLFYDNHVESLKITQIGHYNPAAPTADPSYWMNGLPWWNM